ncbi:hypothetical protein [Gilvimarinus xylanilyticus]|uniref:Uncharacterized protein n=1 Tax=Gilvimarinus xylanilyticus TaxID=2944139 RepID=A0A9X2I0J4_9GAMM|nr:hypothetical protein [Gilvimarinus xylanilyticus]MCP8900444.1 hypothetical protein [Gilvimarinus xylanilyticus]
MNTFLTQVKREFWESPGQLIKAPLWLSVLIISISLMSVYSLFQDTSVSFELNLEMDLPWNNDSAPNSVPKGGILDKLVHIQYIIYLIFTVVAVVNMVTYSLSALLTDRQDRSVLFFKSLPVTETTVVLVKLLIALLIMPICYWLGAMLTTLVFSALTVVVGTSSLSLDPFTLWSAMDALAVAKVSFAYLWFAALWGLPLFSVLLLFSAWSKKHPFGILLLVLLVAWFVENLLFGQSYVFKILIQYFDGFSLQSLEATPDDSSILAAAIELLSRPGLYMGWIVAGVSLGTAIWLRNRRFEL